MKTDVNHHDQSINSNGSCYGDLSIKTSYPADYVGFFHEWVARDAGVGSQLVCRRKRRKSAGVAADRPTTCCSFIERAAPSMHAPPYPYHTIPRLAQGSTRTGSLLPVLLPSKNVTKHVIRSLLADVNTTYSHTNVKNVKLLITSDKRRCQPPVGDLGQQIGEFNPLTCVFRPIAVISNTLLDKSKCQSLNFLAFGFTYTSCIGLDLRQHIYVL